MEQGGGWGKFSQSDGARGAGGWRFGALAVGTQEAAKHHKV